MAPDAIAVYTLPWWGHRARAQALLRRRGLPFARSMGAERRISGRRLAEVTGGYTAPQIVIHGEPFPFVPEIRRISPSSLLRCAVAHRRGRGDISAAKRVGVKIYRAGRVLETDDPTHPDRAEEERDGEGLRRIAS